MIKIKRILPLSEQVFSGTCVILDEIIQNKHKNKIRADCREVLGQDLLQIKQEAISQKEIVFRFRKDIQSLKKAGILISRA